MQDRPPEQDHRSSATLAEPERSPGDETPSAPSHEVEHVSLGQSYEADEDRPLLDSGLERGLDMDYGCRVGSCGACAVEVVEGLENFQAPDPIEEDALARYDLGPRVRLGCRACIKGRVRIKSLM